MIPLIPFPHFILNNDSLGSNAYGEWDWLPITASDVLFNQAGEP